MRLTAVLTHNWWAMLIRGIAALVFGLLALFWPTQTLFALVLLFGAYALVDGVFAITAALRARNPHGSGWLMIEGLVGVLIGMVTFLVPDLTALALLSIIAAWAILTGAAEIAQAILLRRQIAHEWLLIVSGALSLLLGVVLALYPGAGALRVIGVIGLYALLFGALLVGLSLRLRRLSHTQRATSASPSREAEMTFQHNGPRVS